MSDDPISFPMRDYADATSNGASVPLDEVCVKSTGMFDPRTKSDDPFLYVDISSVDNKRKRIIEAKTLLGKHAPSRARQIIRANDVLVATTRPNLNAVAIVPPGLDGAICSTAFCVLRSNGRIAPEYLFAFVQTDQFVHNLSDLVNGALYPAVKDYQVRSQRISLPEMTLQKSIAERLRKRLSEAERARAAVEAQLQAADALTEVLLRESLSFASPTAVPECLREVTEGVGGEWQKFHVLGATRAGLAPAKESVGKRPERYKPVRVGTVFYNPMRILLGSIAMVDEGDEPGITSPDYVVITSIENRLHPRWFYYWFRSNYGADFIKSLSRGAVRERLLFRRLAKGTIPLPALTAQQNFANQVGEIRQLKLRLTQKLNEIERIPAGLLRDVFNGKA